MLQHSNQIVLCFSYGGSELCSNSSRHRPKYSHSDYDYLKTASFSLMPSFCRPSRVGMDFAGYTQNDQDLHAVALFQRMMMNFQQKNCAKNVLSQVEKTTLPQNNYNNNLWLLKVLLLAKPLAGQCRFYLHLLCTPHRYIQSL